MPGKLCVGQKTNNIGAARLRSSKAYCEGMAFRAQGTAIPFPITGNPHLGTNSEAEDAWNFGWTIADLSSPSEITDANLACCASVGLVPA